MQASFEKKVADFINQNTCMKPHDKILLAVSGGADSIALLLSFCNLKKDKLLNNDFICVHINHQLRAQDADADENFVLDICEKLSIRVITRRIDVRRSACENKLSIETAARQLRIDTLLDIAKTENCTSIATGHHKDDNAETILQRLSRGTGFRGLAGIWPVKSFTGINFVRPLLALTRNQIIEYLRQKNHPWCTDHTNADCTYTRNFIRHWLIPDLLNDYNGSLSDDLLELSLAAQKLYRSVCGNAEDIQQNALSCSDPNVILDSKVFPSLHPEVTIELIRLALTAAGVGQADMTHRHYKRILNLTQNNISGTKIELPGGISVLYEYRRLIFSAADQQKSPDETESAEITIPGSTTFAGCLIEASIIEASAAKPLKLKTENSFTEHFDLDKLALPLTIRFRKPGDRFIPFGSTKEKKIGKFLTDQRIPQSIREKVLVVEDAEKIIWLCPIRMSEQAKITEKTQKILSLRITIPDS
ncbi:MAG: tRNA lysidine(34) synthetase TilS [Planctomycetota bacterium]|jgi:tRNA(Ile)-lysidine synthase